MGTILEQGALLGADPMDPAGGFQLFQLAVDGGKTYRVAGLPQVGGQIRGGQSLFRPLLQTVENGLLLFGGIYHKKTSLNLKMRIIFVLYSAAKKCQEQLQKTTK
jgi:hypothetical protein